MRAQKNSFETLAIVPSHTEQTQTWRNTQMNNEATWRKSGAKPQSTTPRSFQPTWWSAQPTSTTRVGLAYRWVSLANLDSESQLSYRKNLFKIQKTDQTYTESPQIFHGLPKDVCELFDPPKVGPIPTLKSTIPTSVCSTPKFPFQKPNSNQINSD